MRVRQHEQTNDMRPEDNQQTCSSKPMLFYCWTTVADGGSTIKQHWGNICCSYVECLLTMYTCPGNRLFTQGTRLPTRGGKIKFTIVFNTVKNKMWINVQRCYDFKVLHTIERDVLCKSVMVLYYVKLATATEINHSTARCSSDDVSISQPFKHYNQTLTSELKIWSKGYKNVIAKVH